MKGGWEGRGRKRGSCVVSLYVKRLAELQSPLSEQVLTTWLPPSLPLTLFLSQMAGWSVQLWPFTLVDRWDYYLPNTHFANTLQHSYQATLTIHRLITRVCIAHILCTRYQAQPSYLVVRQRKDCVHKLPFTGHIC